MPRNDSTKTKTNLKRSLVHYIILLLFLWGALRWFEYRNLYYPTRELRMNPTMVGLPYEDIEFVAEDDTPLHGWWIPHEQARGTLIFCHGNAGNIGDRVFMAEFFHNLELNVFLFDYRGYGKSRGLPSEKGTYRDARAAYELVLARQGGRVSPPILVYGRSLGGAIALQLALDKPVHALIMESTFSSVVEMAAVLMPWLPARYLVRFRYDSLAKIDALQTPLLLAHSRNDEMIPFDQGQRLFAAAPEPKTFVELSGGHNDSGWETTPPYSEAIHSFVEPILASSGEE